MADINKKDVIKLLEDIAVLLELKAENPFKIQAYRKAAQILETDQRSLREFDDLTKINGIGAKTAATIQDYIENGYSETLQALQKQVPEGLIPLLDLPGLGGKKLSKLYHELDVIDITSLEEACQNEKVSALKGFGKKTEENILKAIQDYKKQPERLPVDDMLKVSKQVESYLDSIEAIDRYSIAGSMRRLRETVKDLDFIISTKDFDTVRKALIEMPNIKEIIANGQTKISIIITWDYDVSIDFRLVEDHQFATTLHHFTGSKDHNVAMRQRAKAQGKKISEYGVLDIETGDIETFESEEDFFQSFGLTYIPPERREADGELDRFEEAVDLVESSMIKGDLHMHTTWSDGAESLEDMAQFVTDKGYHYMAVTDHSKFLRVAHGLNEKRLRDQIKEIERVRQLYPDLTIFSGIEMDILPDGTLDFDDTVLAELDFVIASIHSSFNQTEDQIMYRLNQAMENPYVHMIAHPTGRIIGKREGYAVDVDKLITKAKETKTILELNANPKRLDLNSVWLKKAQEKGVKIAINTDAHRKSNLDFINEGVKMARKGWLNPDSVINTYSVDQLKSVLKEKKNR
ncbi:DNA polymerase (family 10) [Pelagirhabdus alkalitolerans]|uniref:DNA polymerase beta n=1 Tax=Pelagirhabdus alkalitolerans TaxID=1612202 RepID=A0A1G6HLH6_9BACI|nr:DNA polymerase/3'-5' exonuclease PolX [Pelagirhabdus alkalitolerans]SDB95110.1 DNA polymerase (family 10) [Pelagirhabdus alkalitolerans]